VFFVTEPFWPLNTTLYVSNFHGNDERFISYFLQCQGLGARDSASAVPGINRNVLHRLRARRPPLPVQRKIAAILSAYEILIENNNRRINVLEEMAQRIYREWFVDFRYPGHEGVPLTDSELGPIPQGWEVRALFDIAKVTFGHSFKSDAFNATDGEPVVRIRDILEGESRTLTTEVADEKYRVADGDILIGMDGDFHMGRWSAGSAWLNQRVVRLRPASKAVCRYSLFLALEEPIAHWNKAIVGTTVAHLGKHHLEKIRIITAPPPITSQLRSLLDPLFDLEVGLRKTTRLLRVAYELLLPRLVSTSPWRRPPHDT
jgi:type I restriction enzyme S subunit